MEISVADPTGFCFGVRRAIEELESALAGASSVFSIGMPIHNPQEVERLKKKGLIVVESVDEIPRGATVFVRAHGEPRNVYDKLKDLNVEVIDATCPFVKRVQDTANELSENGYLVALLGDKNHPEVRSIVGHSGDKIEVFAKPENALSLEWCEKIGVISQTTQREGDFEKLVAILSQKTANLEVSNTICRATVERQEAVRKLADVVQGIIIVGGRNSANTVKLYEIAKSRGTDACLIESAEELEEGWLQKKSRIGVAAGASTPQWVIETIIKAVVKMTANKGMEVMEEQFESMESLLENDKAAHVRKGAIVTGKIVSKTDNGWLVDVGYKCEGFLPAKEWTQHAIVGDKPEPDINDEVTVQVLSVREGEEAQLLVSRWRCELDRRWKELEEKTSQNEFVKVKGLRKTKGGLMVGCCGLEGFMPLSHLMSEGRGGNPAKFIGEEFDAKLIEKDQRKHRLVFSRKSMMEQEMKVGREKFYEDIKEGMELDGEVSSLTSFGVFVNLGHFDGLVHTTELSWKRGTKMKDAFKKGDKVKVRVVKIEKDKDRISLSIKQTLADPWDTISERWSKGMVVKSHVTNVADFGAFVELEQGVEGLIHIGDVSWTKVKHPKEVIRKGQEVEVVLLDIDEAKRRISLGYKQLNDPWMKCADKYEKGQDVKVKVVRLTDFGAFVEVESGIEGLVHISQLSQKRVEHPKDVLTEKQEVLARIIEVTPERRRMRLSLSVLEEPVRTEGGTSERRERSPKKRDSGKEREPKEVYVPDGETGVSIGDIFKRVNISE